MLGAAEEGFEDELGELPIMTESGWEIMTAPREPRTTMKKPGRLMSFMGSPPSRMLPPMMPMMATHEADDGRQVHQADLRMAPMLRRRNSAMLVDDGLRGFLADVAVAVGEGDVGIVGGFHDLEEVRVEVELGAIDAGQLDRWRCPEAWVPPA
ncbi:hypothetical protein O0235_09280 [Tepidiforma flava]|uniref:Uncharacterized protein n=1 Tax=Tepidiforma flava TaxID=3004094 RepID=A0ABY7M4F5_9CHLR|nr:hypothetical protein [Tepidiforma flava]WBL34984.1 hypothetical protein O0235_09280 [Tepidiforma flava]